MGRSLNVRKSLSTLAVFGILSLGFAVTAKADMVDTCDPDAPGQCIATVNITGNVLTITIANTSPPAMVAS